jgi:hypothetical protein
MSSISRSHLRSSETIHHWLSGLRKHTKQLYLWVSYPKTWSTVANLPFLTSCQWANQSSLIYGHFILVLLPPQHLPHLPLLHLVIGIGYLLSELNWMWTPHIFYWPFEYTANMGQQVRKKGNQMTLSTREWIDRRGGWFRASKQALLSSYNSIYDIWWCIMKMTCPRWESRQNEQ